MKNFRLRKLWLISHKEKRARFFPFDHRVTVVMGPNETGKSCLLKSLYYTFGATPPKLHSDWKAANIYSLAEFSINDSVYYLFRAGNLFGLYDKDGRITHTFSGVTHGVGAKLAELLDFNITLPNRDGETIVPPPAYCFLPFYIDQDAGWNRNWNSFERLAQIPNFKADLAYFHSGIRPKEYYHLKGEIEKLSRLKKNEEAEREVVHRTHNNLNAKKKALPFVISDEDFKAQIDELLKECKILQRERERHQAKVSELYTSKAILVEQSRIAEEALKELDADFEFISARFDPEIICPTCGTLHNNSFANRFSLISDAETCRDFVLRTRNELMTIERQIQECEEAFYSTNANIENIEKLLSHKRGELRLKDLIESEGTKQLEEMLRAQLEQHEQEIGRLATEMTRFAQEMKKFENKDRRQQITAHFQSTMTKFLALLNVSSLAEKDYKKIDCAINETGSQLPRALLAYYYSFISTMAQHSTSCFCPIVLDTPNQQDQDPSNVKAIIEFALNHLPEKAQLILGTVELHGVDYNGHTIRTGQKRSLLLEEEYNKIAEMVAPFHNALIN